MPPILSAQSLSKRYGVAPLFRNISFTVSGGERIGLIGPNGSGKSTLMEILAGRIKPDTGDVALRKRARLSSAAQVSEFAPADTVRSVIENAFQEGQVPEHERAGRFAEVLGRAGFEDHEAIANSLSGGWRKRLAIAAALVQEPDILLLDEPTNHLDLEGIEWLESVLRSASFACVVVSHDRYFLENVTNAMVELSRSYDDGFLRVSGKYSKFLEAKENYLHAQQKRQEVLENRVHVELEWLRRGPKARTTKSKARIDTAHELMGDLADLSSRTRSTSANINFSATNRQSRQLVQLDDVSFSFGARKLFKEIQFSITNGMRVGLVGPNGSGKSTLLRLLLGELKPEEGEIRKADNLRVVYFDQNRRLEPDTLLRRALAPDSDSVIYQDRVIHVASWAARFLFAGEDLNRPVGSLSGGERARVLIAQLMLQPADVLLLDEPTNDLDIPTLEILEESLLEFTGALVLVTHDRFLLDRVSTLVFGLDGMGGAERFADYFQWEEWKAQNEQARATDSAAASNGSAPSRAAIAARGPAATSPASSKRKLSYKEARELELMEKAIHDAEVKLQEKLQALHNSEISTDASKLHAASVELEQAQKTVENLYSRWAELEAKLA
ncbi:MAG TPA: ABC-F family ATP-binding cassette domain-containing protein [Candidatus Eisenbacteria bacterium]|nr:ABC-F family ATP-binding cassette domain-containing protein [Candidatus Eisenbacteria bacterium]